MLTIQKYVFLLIQNEKKREINKIPYPITIQDVCNLHRNFTNAMINDAFTKR